MDVIKPGNDQSEWPRRFAVFLDREHLEQFVNCTVRGSGDTSSVSVPITYPVSWLKLPDVEAAILESVGVSFGDGRTTLLHLEQLIEVHKKLQVDEHYFLDVERGQHDTEEKFTITANVLSKSGQRLVTLQGTFLVLEQGRALS